MDWFELPFATPEAMLAWDEALLDRVEAGGPEALWFWEATRPFVVVGYGQSVEREVDTTACRARDIPVLRRCSGGGAVVQAPGSLCYGLALRIEGDPALATVAGTNARVMDRIRQAVCGVVGEGLRIEGHTDLALDGRKVSGNAQRRRRRALLFHGTLLHGLDPGLLGIVLRYPSVDPAYRRGRPHAGFVTNLPVPRDRLVESLCREWAGGGGPGPVPDLEGSVAALVRERYGSVEWNRRR